jgi:hypothetical protein
VLKEQCKYLGEPESDPGGLSPTVRYRCLLDLDHEGDHNTEIIVEDYMGTGIPAHFREGFGVLDATDASTNYRYIHKSLPPKESNE